MSASGQMKRVEYPKNYPPDVWTNKIAFYLAGVEWGGSRGSNEPPKIFEVGIFGELKR